MALVIEERENESSLLSVPLPSAAWLPLIAIRVALPCAQRAARDLRISPRWLHALLEDGEISFADRAARRRIEECSRLLCEPAHDHLSIAEIAFRWGFSNLSTFYRRFHAQYGTMPRDVRRLRMSETQL